MQIVISCEGLHTMCTLRAFFCLVLTIFLVVLPNFAQYKNISYINGALKTYPECPEHILVVTASKYCNKLI